MESRLARNNKTSASSSRSRKFITDEAEDQRAIRRRKEPTSGANSNSFPSSTSTQRPPIVRCPFPSINANPAQYLPAAPYYASAGISSTGRISSLNRNVHGPHDIAGSQSHFRGGISDIQNTRFIPLADQSTGVTAYTHVDTSSSSPLQRGKLAYNYMELPSSSSSSTDLMQHNWLYNQVRKRRIFDSTNSMQQQQYITPDQRTARPNIVVHQSNYNLVNRYYSNILEGLSETSSTPNIQAVQRRPQIGEALRVTTRCTEAGMFSSSSIRLAPSSFIQTNAIVSVDRPSLSSQLQSQDTPFLSQTAAGYADYVNYDTRGMMNFPSESTGES